MQTTQDGEPRRGAPGHALGVCAGLLAVALTLGECGAQYSTPAEGPFADWVRAALGEAANVGFGVSYSEDGVLVINGTLIEMFQDETDRFGRRRHAGFTDGKTYIALNTLWFDEGFTIENSLIWVRVIDVLTHELAHFEVAEFLDDYCSNNFDGFYVLTCLAQLSEAFECLGEHGLTPGTADANQAYAEARAGDCLCLLACGLPEGKEKDVLLDAANTDYENAGDFWDHHQALTGAGGKCEGMEHPLPPYPPTSDETEFAPPSECDCANPPDETSCPEEEES